MITKSKFNVGDTVYITLEAAGERFLLYDSLPMRYFQLGKTYIIERIDCFYEYPDTGKEWEILVEGSNQYLNENYFSKDKQQNKPISLLNYTNEELVTMSTSITDEEMIIHYDKEINFNNLLNKYGPEGLYLISDKLKQLADEDIKLALQQALQQEPSIESICETKAELFTNETLKSVDSLLSDDYRIGFKEGIEKYLIKNYNTNDVIK